jgi:hypothetical protein
MQRLGVTCILYSNQGYEVEECLLYAGVVWYDTGRGLAVGGAGRIMGRSYEEGKWIGLRSWLRDLFV